jgi:hypothetical protein
MMDIRLQYHPEDSTIFSLSLYQNTYNKHKGKKERKREKY